MDTHSSSRVCICNSNIHSSSSRFKWEWDMANRSNRLDINLIHLHRPQAHLKGPSSRRVTLANSSRLTLVGVAMAIYKGNSSHRTPQHITLPNNNCKTIRAILPSSIHTRLPGKAGEMALQEALRVGSVLLRASVPGPTHRRRLLHPVRMFHRMVSLPPVTPIPGITSAPTKLRSRPGISTLGSSC